ncbi:multicopper oxidase, partial [Saccharata proteae CBS 121410]
LNPSQHVKRPAQVFQHHWRITAGDRSPDGVKKRVYLINDAFPGPTIEARSGDTLVIELENALDEGLAIHWHGLHMRGFNHMDGAVGFTQDPVPPGENFTYRFDISDDQAGSFWWHAHHQEQRADGLYGGLVVHRPIDVNVDVPDPVYDEERLLMMGDWYHRPATDVLAWYMSARSFGNEPVPDSLLVNGLGAYNCSNAVPARPVECVQREDDKVPNLAFDAGKKYRLRVVNTGSLAGLKLGIEGASLTAFGVDGGNAVQSTPASSIGILYPGQRVDLLVEFPSTKPSTLTIELDTTGFKYPNPALTNLHHFPLRLSSPPTSSLLPPPPSYFPLSLLTPHPLTPSLPLPLTPPILLYTTTLKLSRLHNIPHGFINHSTYTPTSPPLLSLPRPHWPPQNPLLPPPIPANSSVDVVLNNLDDTSHPFHLHGNSFVVLQSYEAPQPGWPGSWNPWEGGGKAKQAPPGGAIGDTGVRRDTIMVPRRGYVVLRVWAGSRGLWMMHCHVLWHMAGGMVAGLEVV